MNYDDLKKLDELRKNGAITEEEYQREKNRILNQTYLPSTEKMYWGMTENSYIALMHVAQFGGYIIPFLGFILPVIMWLNSKDQNTNIDRHGKNIVNFILSWLLYALVAGILSFVLVSIPLAIALAVSQIVFIILATIKAANNEYWKYPLSIEFIK